MIGILLDQKLEQYFESIDYTFKYIFNTLGYQFKYISSLSQLGSNDLLFCYALVYPKESEMRYISDGRPAIFCKAEEEFYKFSFERQDLPDLIIKTIKRITVFSNEKNKEPFIQKMFGENYYGQINFDLIANIFFSLVSYEEHLYGKKDELGRFDDNENILFKEKDSTRVTHLTELLNDFIVLSVQKNKKYIVRKNYWPKNEDYALLISHTINRLKKWSFKNLILDILKDLNYLISLKFGAFWSLFKDLFLFILEDIEPYWCFESFINLDKKFGLKATYFFADNPNIKDNEIDYDLEDKDVVKIIEILQKNGNEISLLIDSSDTKNPQLINKHLTKLTKIVNKQIKGYRVINNKIDLGKLLISHTNSNASYCSNWSYNTSNGFKNGITFLFKPFVEDKKTTPKMWFIPISFSDTKLWFDKTNYISYEEAKEIVTKLHKSLIKNNGVLSFEISSSNFIDIPYADKLVNYIYELEKSSNIYKTTHSQLIDWWEKRQKIRIMEERNYFKIYFPEKLTDFSVTITSTKNIMDIKGSCKSALKNNVIHFSGIESKSEAIVYFENKE
jgi:hypothetical protein